MKKKFEKKLHELSFKVTESMQKFIDFFIKNQSQLSDKKRKQIIPLINILQTLINEYLTEPIKPDCTGSEKIMEESAENFRDSLGKALELIIDNFKLDNKYQTNNYNLAEYIIDSLEVYGKITKDRDYFYGFDISNIDEDRDDL